MAASAPRTCPPDRAIAEPMLREQFTAWTGTPPVRLDGDHEVYLSDPTVLTNLVRSLTP